MEIRILTESEQERYENAILAMLTEGDAEFVPPLSTRTSTTQSDLNGKMKGTGGVLSYFAAVKKQRILAATEEDKLVGFVSFKENFVDERIGEEYLPNIYISTLLVAPEGRGKGLTRRMYEVLFAEYEHANVFTRTWSTNEAHIKILSKFGFETMLVLKNHRGNGIDTVYFKKCIRSF
ncbi:MAG: GNAT family N-acetyltransferase [Oscillospiraceae bacterium]|nr:GNAT family N-acetyltransferase [Oscillospiraceae bacterium]